MPSRVFVKDESRNPTGTFKDRLGWELARRLKEQGADSRTVVSSITLGNTAISLVEGIRHVFGASEKPQVVALVPEVLLGRSIGPDTSGRRVDGRLVLERLRSVGIQCIISDFRDRPLLIEDIRQILIQGGVTFRVHLDVSAGIPEPCYSPILVEALAELTEYGVEPAAILVPVGAGVLFDTIVDVVEARRLSTLVFGAAVLRMDSLADKLDASFSGYATDLRTHGLAHAKRSGRHSVRLVSEEAIAAAVRRLSGEVDAEPSAAAALALLVEFPEVQQKGPILMINTGNGLPWILGE